MASRRKRHVAAHHEGAPGFRVVEQHAHSGQADRREEDRQHEHRRVAGHLVLGQLAGVAGIDAPDKLHLENQKPRHPDVIRDQDAHDRLDAG